MYRALLRASAVALAVLTAAFLVQLGGGGPRPLSPLLVARALTVGAIFHVGLFLAPDARRGWQRLAAAAVMLPSVLILGSMAGEAATRVARGFALRFLPVAIASVGLIAYSVAFVSLARRPKRAPPNALND